MYNGNIHECETVEAWRNYTADSGRMWTSCRKFVQDSGLQSTAHELWYICYQFLTRKFYSLFLATETFDLMQMAFDCQRQPDVSRLSYVKLVN
jgi:hypothetical protein